METLKEEWKRVLGDKTTIILYLLLILIGLFCLYLAVHG